MDATKRHQNYLGENPTSKLILLTDTPYPRLRVVFGGADAVREPLEIEADDFIGLKSFKAKGKRLTTFTIDHVKELEPTRQPEPEDNGVNEGEGGEDIDEPEDLDPDQGKTQQQVIDEITGQLNMFTDDDFK